MFSSLYRMTDEQLEKFFDQFAKYNYGAKDDCLYSIRMGTWVIFGCDKHLLYNKFFELARQVPAGRG